MPRNGHRIRHRRPLWGILRQNLKHHEALENAKQTYTCQHPPTGAFWWFLEIAESHQKAPVGGSSYTYIDSKKRCTFWSFSSFLSDSRLLRQTMHSVWWILLRCARSKPRTGSLVNTLFVSRWNRPNNIFKKRPLWFWHTNARALTTLSSQTGRRLAPGLAAPGTNESTKQQTLGVQRWMLETGHFFYGALWKNSGAQNEFVSLKNCGFDERQPCIWFKYILPSLCQVVSFETNHGPWTYSMMDTVLWSIFGPTSIHRYLSYIH